MSKKIYLMLTAVLVLVMTIGIYYANVDAQYETPAGKTAQKEKNVKVETCYECHDQIKELHTMGMHAKVNCANCHKGLEKHLKAEVQTPDTRPVTDTSWEACGQCHKEQYDSFMKTAYHRPARDEKSQLTNRSPNPFWDKLMMGHGFTKEHNLTRSHNKMLIDHLVVDRSYGGRFQGKNGWEYILESGRVWDVLEDKYPDVADHKAFIPQSAPAANSVCLQCKSQDQILKWAYMGDPVDGAEWSRTSKVIEVAKDLQHGLNCFYCHDPHAAKPRIVRDGLIDALTKPDGDTLWHKDPNRTGIKVIDMGLRGFTRKIAMLDKYDTRLQCGQCHVEYNCNPGYDPKNSDISKPSVTMADRRTNHFPYKDVFGLYDHYVNKVSFLDFKHALTGGLLWKAQHPEAESYYNSKHAKAGAGCDSCHMPKMKDKKTGKEYTSHFAVTPSIQIKEACLKCHPKWTEEQAKYTIDSIKAHIRGKMRKAEFWLSNLIDKIVEGKKAGLDAEIIKQAQDQHLRAHILWEYWTAENSDGFHNPEMAREALTKSVDESQKGIKIINDAIAAMAPPAK
ncbi:MAG: ammonia-forming cytochrome c nitrite reductase subunit c552 [Thermodesulfovibrionia bacterium]|nr:ammonia-forming cytochrome c nitrite reductase subunit c552 [Thermodesulfovibrionia bacterium]